MSSNRIHIMLICILMLFASCSSNDNNTNDNDLIIYEEGHTTITLISVDDSRCPVEGTCVWEGNANVVMRIEKNNESEEFSLNTFRQVGNDSFPNSITIFDLNIELIDVEPYNSLDVEYNLEDYIITLDVTN